VKERKWLKVLGPGILFAGTAIGVSHLVQSTRAGADYGYTLVWAIVLANFFKYPFFEFGSRYAQATQTSLLVGYKKMGNWQLWLYFGITILSMFPVIAAVSFVTVAIISSVSGGISSTAFAFQAIGLYAFCVVILLWGKYKALDKTVKVLAALMFFSIIAVMILLALHPVTHVKSPTVLPIWQDSAQLIFVIALMGWMPTAVDLSTWSSIWTVERMRETKFIPTLKQTLNEFRVGYLASAISAIFFLVLGAELMFYSGDAFPDAPSAFSSKLISLFTKQIGAWSYPLIAIAALGVMLSTTITVFDGYTRAMSETSQLFLKGSFFGRYSLWLLIAAAGGVVVLLVFLNQLKVLVDMATILSFLVAPIVAYLNYKLVNSTSISEGSKPSKLLNYWALAGILFLTGFAMLYLVTVFSS
jgi:Mn2+/Fe2+ NRAMP family transporter